MKRRVGWIAIGLLLVAGVAVAGCGGGGSSSTKSTTAAAAITKAQFVAKANAICTTGNGPILAAGAQLASRPSPSQVVSIVRHVYVPSVESELASIKALGVPAGEEAIFAKMLRLAQAELAKLKRNPALVTTDVFGGFARVAHPYGLIACAPTS
ncbi:MAG TPA: hypothetical protein VGO14_11480 [Solirubrobacteraceae bacterium]|nr:hypothetical protein [Solirubrobacteraceae bacterium]